MLRTKKPLTRSDRPVSTKRMTPYSYHTRRRVDSSNSSSERTLISHQQAIKQKPSKRKQVFILCCLVIFLGVVLVSLVVNSSPKIVIIEPSGYQYLPHSKTAYTTAATAAINSSIYNHFKLTISSNDIATYLEKRYPEIDQAYLTIPFIGFSPTVTIELAPPALIYTTTTSTSYLLTSLGSVIAPASILPLQERTSLADVTTTTASPLIADGDQVVSPADVQFIELVHEALYAKGISVSKMNILISAEELDVYPTGVSYYIKFNLQSNNALEQVGTYLATLNTIKQQGSALPSQYIDVRVEGRAYYK